jgi:hypothetical protein
LVGEKTSSAESSKVSVMLSTSLKAQLRRCRISRLLRLTSEQAMTQQRVFLFKMNNPAFVRLAYACGRYEQLTGYTAPIKHAAQEQHHIYPVMPEFQTNLVSDLLIKIAVHSVAMATI